MQNLRHDGLRGIWSNSLSDLISRIMLIYLAGELRIRALPLLGLDDEQDARICVWSVHLEMDHHSSGPWTASSEHLGSPSQPGSRTMHSSPHL